LTSAAASRASRSRATGEPSSARVNAVWPGDHEKRSSDMTTFDRLAWAFAMIASMRGEIQAFQPLSLMIWPLRPASRLKNASVEMTSQSITSSA
jgi:hypothetical protein